MEATIILPDEGSMLIIGERINSSRSSIQQAIEKRDSEFILNEAIIQANAGADYIDVNAGTRSFTICPHNFINWKTY